MHQCICAFVGRRPGAEVVLAQEQKLAAGGTAETELVGGHAVACRILASRRLRPVLHCVLPEQLASVLAADRVNFLLRVQYRLARCQVADRWKWIASVISTRSAMRLAALYNAARQSPLDSSSHVTTILWHSILALPCIGFNTFADIPFG